MGRLEISMRQRKEEHQEDAHDGGGAHASSKQRQHKQSMIQSSCSVNKQEAVITRPYRLLTPRSDIAVPNVFELSKRRNHEAICRSYPLSKLIPASCGLGAKKLQPSVKLHQARAEAGHA